MNEFPWLIIPGLVGIAVAFFVQFRLKYYIDRDKIINLQDMTELYPGSIPPKKFLNEQGQKLYRWFEIGGAVFMGSIILSLLWDFLKQLK
jgi:hypothetical protein